MLLACTRRRHSRHAKPYPKVILERQKHLFGSLEECELHSGPPIALLPIAHAFCLRPQAPQSACQTIPKVILERRKHLFGSLGEYELHFGPPKYCLLSFLLLTLLACTRRRHSRHAKPYPKVILERRLLGECELHSGPPIALLPTAHASCLHPQAPQSACQTIPKSNFGASKTPFRITRRV